MTDELARKELAVKVRKEVEWALKVARGLWPAGTNDQAVAITAGTVLEHFRELGRKPAAARAAAANGSQPAGGGPPECPHCGGEMRDNRSQKKNPREPDFRCKDDNCRQDGNHTTGVWLDRPKKGRGGGGGSRQPQQQPRQQPAPARVKQESFDDFPEALDGDDDDLPF